MPLIASALRQLFEGVESGLEGYDVKRSIGLPPLNKKINRVGAIKIG